MLAKQIPAIELPKSSLLNTLGLKASDVLETPTFTKPPVLVPAANPLAGANPRKVLGGGGLLGGLGGGLGGANPLASAANPLKGLGSGLLGGLGGAGGLGNMLKQKQSQMQDMIKNKMQKKIVSDYNAKYEEIKKAALAEIQLQGTEEDKIKVFRKYTLDVSMVEKKKLLDVAI